MIENVKLANLALAFFLELWVFVSLGYWGFHTGSTPFLRISLEILVPLSAAVVWGVFLAPKSSRRLGGWTYRCLKLLVFGFSVVALWSVGSHSFALILGGAVIVNQILQFVWGQR